MYLSLNWLKELVKVPNSLSVEEIGTKLTNYTVEVEKIAKQAARFDKVVVGQVLEVKKHPNSDHLNLTKVDVGEKEPLAIVCGAANVSAGQMVAVALVGAELPNGMKIEEREVRGEKSFGMICAEDELGLGNDHAGIMVLEHKSKIGELFSEYLELDDIVFEVDNKSLSNRPDLWGHIGIAREISALFDLEKSDKFQHILGAKIAIEEGREKLSVKVEDNDLCPRYMALKIEGVAIVDSPVWLQKKLTAVGMHPINNIVDATNYAMLELGEPMHAFDASVVSEIVVRRAKKEESIKTLDGVERILDNSMLVIADKERAIAVAGVMGGEFSEINSATKSIILEAATFDASSIRKTSTKLSLRTEASMRFEKSLDPNLCEAAIARCLEIIRETCPEVKIASELVDLSNFSLKTGPVELDLKWIANRLGDEIDKKEIIGILQKLGFGIENSDEEKLLVTIPTWRATKDISIKEDILEEIARIHGYNNFKISMPAVVLRAPEINEERRIERQVKNILANGTASTEVYNYSFVGEEKLAKLKINSDSYLKLVNPMSSFQTMLRQNLFENLIDDVKINQAKYSQISLFEIGRVFYDASGRTNKNSDKKENLPFQEKRLAILEASDKGSDAYQKAKGKFEHLAKYFGLAVTFEVAEMVPEWADKNYFAKVVINNEEVGIVTNFGKEISGSLGVKKDVALLEVSFKNFVEFVLAAPLKQYSKPNKFPNMDRDLAFVVKENVLYNDIKREISKFDELIVSTELFDVYQGKNLETGLKSLAFHITYSSPEKTLESAVVDAIQDKLIGHLKDKFEAQIRNF